jgi:hypothetical protein
MKRSLTGLIDVTVVNLVLIRVTVRTVFRTVRVVLALVLTTVLRRGQQYFAAGPEVLPKVAPMGQTGHKWRYQASEVSMELIRV